MCDVFVLLASGALFFLFMLLLLGATVFSKTLKSIDKKLSDFIGGVE